MPNYLARVWTAIVMAASMADAAVAADLRVVNGRVLKETPTVDGRPTEAGGIPADSIAQVLPDKGDPTRHAAMAGRAWCAIQLHLYQ